MTEMLRRVVGYQTVVRFWTAEEVKEGCSEWRALEILQRTVPVHLPWHKEPRYRVEYTKTCTVPVHTMHEEDTMCNRQIEARQGA